jgi:hypothetical protein
MTVLVRANEVTEWREKLRIAAPPIESAPLFLPPAAADFLLEKISALQ